MKEQAWYEAQLLERFLRYVQIDTTSDRSNTNTIPSTAGQWELARLLVAELRELGIEDVELNDECFVIARLKGVDSNRADDEPVGLLAHLDTTEDFIGSGVVPQVHRNYDGGKIQLSRDWVLDPEEFPDLRRYSGETIITTSGTTLLGADDKAGIAEIMTAAAWLQAHPTFRRSALELIFTPDEENAMGIRRFPRAQIRSRYCYTVDGGDEAIIEAECFNAWGVTVRCFGYSIHPGLARGKMINPITIATALISMLPQSESPEATDGRYGYYCPLSIEGTFESARIVLYIRDFERSEVERRVEVIRALGALLERTYPGSRVEVLAEKQYVNMQEAIDQHPQLVDYARRAIRESGMEPELAPIRGGTDGSQLTEMGIPTPNLFTGAHNIHGRNEWIALPAMIRATQTLINLSRLWADKQPV